MGSPKIEMVDLKSQYLRLKPSIDSAIHDVLDTCQFINGSHVTVFEKKLASYLDVNHVIGCANGTDALQIALMALGLNRDDEVIVPAFTYVATVEVIGLLGLKPIMVDVDYETFNIDSLLIEKAITEKTKAIIPVHLFGQISNMEEIMALADRHNLFVIEDNAQSIGANYTFSNGQVVKSGTSGHISCTSFFPSKNLGCFGDGGAIMTNDENLAKNIRIIANHGQVRKYHHSTLGVNSRLDTIQAAVLSVKLDELDDFNFRRNMAAMRYTQAFEDIKEVSTPKTESFTSHVFHQYTIKLPENNRAELKSYLLSKGIPTMIYYPKPLYEQKAYSKYHTTGKLEVTERLSKEVLSLPIHTELDQDSQEYIIGELKSFFA